ncbi:helix-turn-helix domain-containing protein [Streptomyces sp. NPDC060022]|uniref:helix-turn-helix domain-containing protein n=1 Tax=Streptomyces sp. NPDC060022 TaxID=3347039 RepID=UPI00369E58D3
MAQPQSQPHSLGPLLRGFRHAAGLTLEELADAAGVSDRAIGDMERGHSRGPQARTVQALAEALGLGVQDTDMLLAAARAGRRRSDPVAAGLCDLPPGIPDFAGRAEEAGWLANAGALGGQPQVSIVSGAPGLGKTALVVQTARRQSALYRDGAYFINLRGLDKEPLDPHQALARLMKALGIRDRDLPADGDERQVLYRRLVQDKSALIVLDNAADEAQLRPLLPGGGSSCVWVTSRRALTGIEHARRLALAPLPTEAATALLEAIIADRPSQNTGDDTETAALERIADLCGRLPLALRIAGNRLVSRPAWSARSLAVRLAVEDLRLDRLTAGDLRVQSAFTLSYEHLSGPAKLLFRRLALVHGPDFDPALGAALTSLGLDQVEETMDELIELGLLNPGLGDRAFFHDLIRLYASRRLRDEEPEEDRRSAYAAMNSWLLETACSAGQLFEPASSPSDAPGSLVDLDSQQQAQMWLEANSTNWLAALHDAAASDDHENVVRVAESMHWFSDRWIFWGHWHTVYELSRSASHSLGDDRLEATHANYLAWAYMACLRQPDAASAIALETAELARRAGDTIQQAWSLTYAANAASNQELYAQALPLARLAADLFATTDDKEAYPQALIVLARCLRNTGHAQEAIDTLDTIVRLVNDPHTAPAQHIALFTGANALHSKGLVLLDLEHWEQARETFDKALELDSLLNVPALRGWPAYGRAKALWAQGKRSEALVAVRDAIRSFTSAGDTVQRDEAEALLAQWSELDTPSR